jgi:exonuclease SbcC
MIKKIKLQNWKSHTETELQFTKGINVLVGPMGSGKSSVLQAICFALFGSVPEIKRRDVKVSELVRRDSGSQAAIDLSLETEDKAFQISRIINSKGSEGTVRDSDGVLLAGTNPTQATAFLKHILKLDEDTFLRTVYAKQNEIDLFLQLDPGERKVRLDELMNLHKFEAARKNCVKLANKLSVKKEELENLAKSFELEKLADSIREIDSELLSLKEEKSSLQSFLETAAKEKSNAELQMKEVKAKFDAFTRLEERHNLLIRQTNELKLRVKDKVKSYAEVYTQLQGAQNKISALENYKSELSHKLELVNKDLLYAEKQASVAESRLSDVNIQIEKIAVLKIELEQLIQQLGVPNPKEETERLDAEIKEIDKEIAAAETEARMMRKHLEELKSAQGICPTCTRALELETKEKLTREREATIFDLARAVEDKKNQKTELELQRRKVQDFVAQSEDLQRDIKKEIELVKQAENLQEQLNAAKASLEKSSSDVANKKVDLEGTEKELHSLILLDRELREQLRAAEDKERLLKLEEELAEVQEKLTGKPDAQILEGAEKAFRDALRNYEEFSARQKSIDFVIEEKFKRLNEFRKKQQQAEKLLVESSLLSKKVEFLQQLKNALLVAQEQLRKELITAVNDLMTSLWGKLYPYEKWTSIQLEASDTDYTLQLRTGGGEWVNVAGFASGGERMLAALVLRLAFAKVLAPEFNILILDEPTHNLDDAAINALMLALQEHLPEFLEQLFIVTHEEKLAEVGDNIIRLK